MDITWSLLKLPCPAGASSNLTQAAEDAKALTELDFITAFPSHDHGMGVQRAAVVEFARSLSL